MSDFFFYATKSASFVYKFFVYMCVLGNFFFFKGLIVMHKWVKRCFITHNVLKNKGWETVAIHHYYLNLWTHWCGFNKLISDWCVTYLSNFFLLRFGLLINHSFHNLFSKNNQMYCNIVTCNLVIVFTWRKV